MKILAVGMNYAGHNKEMNHTLLLQDPVIFSKPDSALLTRGRPFFIPSFANRFDHEIEIVVKICHVGKNISERFAHRYYDEVTVGIDFTARDLQDQLTSKGLPWELCKGFDNSAAIGEFVKKETLPAIQELNFHLDIDGKTVQTGFSGNMIHSVDKIVAFVSKYFTLKTGDLIFTGTPSGIGPVHEGQHLEGYLEGNKLLDFNVK
ncbi:MAG: fumarylacetoacetate hydrolase family protein [Bacteroidaceae bacterium]|nr:fumarylacetoacetate hydrolase family protein [Bacteroidaceae bacterium]